MTASLILTACSSDNGKSGTSSQSEGSTEVSGKSGKVKVMKIASAAGEEAIAPYRILEELVEEKTSGSIDVQFYPNAQLGGDVQVLESIRSGTVESGIMSSTILASLDPAFNAFDIPFLFKDTEQAYEVMDGEVGNELLTRLEQYDIIGLGFNDAHFRHLSNNGDVIRTPDDLKGTNIRTLENNLQVKLWSTLGAVPTAIAFNELYTALESNIVTAQENPYIGIGASKIYEVQDYVTETGHVTITNISMVSKKFWDSLTSEEQQVLRDSLKETNESVRAASKELTDEFIEEIQNSGTEIIKLTEDEKQQWINKAQPLYGDYKEVLGEDLFNKIMSATGHS